MKQQQAFKEAAWATDKTRIYLEAPPKQGQAAAMGLASSVAAMGRIAEWPTLFLALMIYGAWALVTVFHERIPALLLAAIGGWLLAWHNSLQHEIIHGHPTRSRRLNTLLALPPLSLWLPFEAYRQSHLAHHATEHLTDPEHDPESRYPAPGPGASRSLARAAARMQSTLFGRLTIGPALEILGFVAKEVSATRRDPVRLQLWASHAAMVCGVLVWLRFVCGMSLTQYLLCFVYPGCALSLIRSFAEHRADSSPAHRVAVVENAPVFGLLFLNNNLHAAHHERPGLAWHRLPRFYANERERILAANGGLVYSGYLDVFRRYLWRPQHSGSARSWPRTGP